MAGVKELAAARGLCRCNLLSCHGAVPSMHCNVFKKRCRNDGFARLVNQAADSEMKEARRQGDGSAVFETAGTKEPPPLS